MSKYPHNQETKSDPQRNRLVEDLRIFPEDATRSGKRTLILDTEHGRLEVDISKREAHLLSVLSDCLHTQLESVDLSERHRGRMGAAEIGDGFGRGTCDMPVTRETVIAYVCRVKNAIRKAARTVGMPPPDVIDSGFGGYRLVRPFRLQRDASTARKCG